MTDQAPGGGSLLAVDFKAAYGRWPLARQLTSALVPVSLAWEQARTLAVATTLGDGFAAQRPEPLVDALSSVTLKAAVRRDHTAAIAHASLFSMIETGDARRGVLFRYRFSAISHELLGEANPQHVDNRTTLLALQSKYAANIFRTLYRKTPLLRLPLTEFRTLAGIPADTYRNWADLWRYAIEPARREIDDFSYFDLHLTEHRQARRVVAIDVAMTPKLWFQRLRAAVAVASEAGDG